ncbi:ImmA/IrrE family metallo-endopeptidase [Clostridium neonatale]|uniref:ImmA/IrrE family metallo-endopeptidase n=1 Tax=Clostridium neonatale TaxID=137838 RepID=UPI00291B430B|nr:ImmA/IrrE family metallo-endopeptidase [Clostridium neonatale]CAI3208575.1 ImmA/IrrE family metallo-endopeptidase [Clostridium neonatale]CAI3212874.1 ImmA/IrrE family metallo-endopeptidase [Clostridium neonatale]
MTAYEKLLIRAEINGIRVKEMDFGAAEECGYYSNNKIIINSRLTDKQKYGVLAEELGHHYKTFGDITDQRKTENRKQELIARRKGFEFILQPLDLVYAFRCGCKNIYEIADFFEITADKLNEIIADFKCKYGVGKKFDKYYITFEPNLGYCEIYDEYVY